MMNTGAILVLIGDYEQARNILTQTVELSTRVLGKEHATTLEARKHLALARREAGTGNQPQIMDAVKEQWRQGKPSANTLQARKNRGDALLLEGKLKEARNIFTDVLNEEIRTLGKFDNTTQRTLLSLVGVQVLEDDFLAASNSIMECLSRNSITIIYDNIIYSSFLSSLAMFSVFLNEPDAAVFFSKLTILTAQTQRGHISGMDRDLQQVYQTRNEKKYSIPISILANLNRNQDALTGLSIMKEDELDDRLRNSLDIEQIKKDFLLSSEQILYQGYCSRMDTLYSLGQELNSLRARSGSLSGKEQSRLTELEMQIDKGVDELYSFLKNIQKELQKRKQNPGAVQTSSANLRQLQDIINRMGESVFVHTLITKDIFYIFVTSSGGVIVRSVRTPRNILNAAIDEFQAALTNPASDPRPAGRKLYNAIIAPIEQDLRAAGAKTLMFSLDGPLRYVPMSALYDGKQWLVEKYDIVMFTEAARKSLRQDASGGGTVAAMGVTRALAGFSALPAVAKEIDGIVQGGSGMGVLPGTTYLDGQFTRKTLADSLKRGVPLVHVASHFQFEPSDQKASFLLLGDGKKLTMGEMFGRKGFSFDKVDLLTLSACDTASGVKKGDGREVESFGALAQRHGAKAVLASLWPVSDASTAAFMRAFYALRGVDKKNKAASLAETQRAMLSGELTPGSAGSLRSQRGKVSVSAHDAGPEPGQTAPGWSHPYFWAPFVLMGNWQ